MMTSFEQHENGRLPITVVILTKNEEKTVAGAISSALQDYQEVVVLDSLSTDRTVEVARNNGAQVIQRKFEGYASQRNFALHEMKKSCDWVFFLDSDERISSELTQELRRVFPKITTTCGMMYVRRKDFFENRWLKRSSGYPTWFGRICHAKFVRVTREINEEYHCEREFIRLKEHILHFPFSKGIAHWVDRHNRYSGMEAEKALRKEPIDYAALFSHDPGLRRKVLKQVFMNLPFRSFFSFLYLYIVKLGFLDGLPGFRYALLRSFYEFMISLKLNELRANRENLQKVNKAGE